jgi:hypothetical protein
VQPVYPGLNPHLAVISLEGVDYHPSVYPLEESSQARDHSPLVSVFYYLICSM